MSSIISLIAIHGLPVYTLLLSHYQHNVKFSPEKALKNPPQNLTRGSCTFSSNIHQGAALWRQQHGPSKLVCIENCVSIVLDATETVSTSTAHPVPWIKEGRKSEM